MVAFRPMPSDKRQRQKEREQAAKEARVAAERRAKQRKTYLQVGGLVVLVVALAALYSFLAGDDGGDDDSTAETTIATTEETTPVDDADPIECPAEDGSSDQTLDFPAPPPDCLVDGATYEAVFDTTAGEIRVALDTEATPITTNNFVYLSRYGYYDDTELFRSNTGIEILQGGAPHTNTSSDPGPGYSLVDEGEFTVDEATGELFGPYTYEPGQLVMARTPLPNGAGAQFFFTTGPGASALDRSGTYVVFGNVTEGLDVLEAIMATHVDGPTAGEGAPDPVPVINAVTIVQS